MPVLVIIRSFQGIGRCIHFASAFFLLGEGRVDGELKEVEAVGDGDGRGVRMGVVEGFWDAEGGEVALEDLVEDA